MRSDSNARVDLGRAGHSIRLRLYGRTGKLAMRLWAGRCLFLKELNAEGASQNYFNRAA